MQKKGILFDLDGTLINTYENINFKQALGELKSVQKSLILKVMKSHVHSFADLENRIMEEVDDAAEGKELISRISSFLLDHYDHAPLKKDALTFLQYLQEKGYKLCLCTNNATEVVEHILREKNMERYFDYVITSQQVRKAKPDPQMYLEALTYLGLPAKDCIVFEDTQQGVMAASSAGIDVIVVNEKEKKKFEQNLVIKDFADQRLYELL